MFATLTGGWPRTAIEAGGRPVPRDAAIEALLHLQADAGLEGLTDGGLRLDDPVSALLAGEPGSLARNWEATATLAASVAPGTVVKQAVPGPLTLADGDPAAAVAIGAILGRELADLAAAGCVLVEVDEPAATALAAEDEPGARAFVEAHTRLLDRVPGIHATLAITGGDAMGLGPSRLFQVPYGSYLLDLVAGPDNWRLAAAAPTERGIICGALRTDGQGGDPAPLLAWAVRYAASLAGRGSERVGLANSASLATLSVQRAEDAVRSLGRAAALSALPPNEAIAAGLDRRSFDARTAATGRTIRTRLARDTRRSRHGTNDG